MKMTREQIEKFRAYVLGDDLHFYKEFIVNLSDEEKEKFFREHPQFLKGEGKV